MTNDELDKLRILSANAKEFCDAICTKLHARAKANGHDMTIFSEESVGFKPSSLFIEYTSYCYDCTFEISIEHMKTDFDDKVYIRQIDADTKCNK